MVAEEIRNGWHEYRLAVLNEQDRVAKVIIKLAEDIVNLKMEIVTMKVKMAMWGMLGASVPVIIGIIIQIFYLGAKVAELSEAMAR